MQSDMNNDYFDDADNGLEEVIREQEEREREQVEVQENQEKIIFHQISSALKPLVEAVNATNQQLGKADNNQKELHSAVKLLARALTTERGENIADYIARQLEIHQRSMANVGIDKLTEQLEKLVALTEGQLGATKIHEARRKD